MKKQKPYSITFGKIDATLYEAFIKEPDREEILNPSIMNQPLDEKEIVKMWDLKNKERTVWYVVVGVIMHRREARNASERRIGCGFDYEIFEIMRGGDVPEDFSYEKYSHTPRNKYEKIEVKE